MVEGYGKVCVYVCGRRCREARGGKGGGAGRPGQEGWERPTDARRQRDLKKFGKAVQVAKLQERDKAKRDTMDKINALKRSMLSYYLQTVHLLTASQNAKAQT